MACLFKKISKFAYINASKITKSQKEVMEKIHYLKKSQDKWPGIWDGFLYFFGLANHPFADRLEAIKKKTQVLSDEEAFRQDAEALRGDWEMVGQTMRQAMHTLQEEHPELKDIPTEKNTSSGQQIPLFTKET